MKRLLSLATTTACTPFYPGHYIRSAAAPCMSRNAPQKRARSLAVSDRLPSHAHFFCHILEKQRWGKTAPAMTNGCKSFKTTRCERLGGLGRYWARSGTWRWRWRWKSQRPPPSQLW